MYWLMTAMMLSSAEPEVTKKIFVAPPTLHDENLQQFQPYLNSLLVSAASVNTHWVKRSYRGSEVFVYDKHTIEYALDTTCDYHKPLQCGSENQHWVLVTDIFTTKNFATIVVKLYDENIQLISSTSKSSYSMEQCSPQVKQTNVKQQGPMGQSNTEIVEKLPDKCIIIQPSILSKDVKQAISILFASIPPS
jgi:hypothetical protein